MNEDYRVIEPGHDEWPTWLSDLGRDEPTQLWIKGPYHLRHLAEQAVAVVGSRMATAYGCDVAAIIAGGLVKHGHPVVSGAAFGIDAAAHRGALAVQERATIAVLPCGIDRAYPVAHTQLLTTIGEIGMVVSEYEPGTLPARHRFLERNRLIVALSKATIVVEAGAHGGTLNSAQWATDVGRRLYAVPGPVTSAASVGTHNLIRSGRAKLITSVEDFLTEEAGGR